MGLTSAAVKAAQPQAKPHRLYDEKGLFLLVEPKGGRLWRLKYRFGGKEKKLALGAYPETGLKEAVCDSCIVEALKLTQRAHAAQITAALGTTSDFKRQEGYCSVCKNNRNVIAVWQ